MAKYFYNKYNLVSTEETITTWTFKTETTSSNFVGFYDNYRMYTHATTGHNRWSTDGNEYSDYASEVGTNWYGVWTSGTTIDRRLILEKTSERGRRYNEYYGVFNTKTVYSQGALVQSNIIAENGTYPNNGQSGGYWYVRGAIATYTVTFKDWNGTVLKTQTVNYGENATPPSQPTRTGYTFNSWSGSYTNVISDRVITATYDVYIPPNPPSAPSSISVPATIKGGEGIAISWGSGSGASRYYLYRSFNGGGYTQIYSGTSRSYSETTSKDWLTIQYRVRAYNSDGYSGYRTSNIVNVIKFPEIYENVNGTQVVYEAGWENVNGTWVEIDSVWENVNGIWIEL